MFRQLASDGGVVSGPLEAAAANFGDEPLRLDAAGRGIGKRLCACPGDHGNSKSEMVSCAMQMFGFFLQNVQVSARPRGEASTKEGGSES